VLWANIRKKGFEETQTQGVELKLGGLLKTKSMLRGPDGRACVDMGTVLPEMCARVLQIYGDNMYTERPRHNYLSISLTAL
jgi:hypothetical protein